MPTSASALPSASLASGAGANGDKLTESGNIHYALHEHPQSSHQQIARLIRRLDPGPLLDVGAAQGMLGQLLQGGGRRLDAVEPQPDWAQCASPFYHTVYNQSIETVELPARFYRVVVCADVLEHTVDPVAVLLKLRAATAPNGIFIVSLPNVAHIAARILLLCGIFPQMERGIFDRTHLHFYTRSTARALLESADLRVRQITPTPVPLQQVWPARFDARWLRLLMALQRPGLRAWPTLFGFQWIIVARAPGA